MFVRTWLFYCTRCDVNLPGINEYPLPYFWGAQSIRTTTHLLGTIVVREIQLERKRWQLRFDVRNQQLVNSLGFLKIPQNMQMRFILVAQEWKEQLLIWKRTHVQST